MVIGMGEGRRDTLGAELVAATYRGGAPALRKLRGTPFRATWLAAPHRFAVEAAEVLAEREEPITLAAAADEIERRGSVTAAGLAEVREAVEAALGAHLESDARDVAAIVDALADAVTSDPTSRLLSAADIFAPLPPVKWLCQAFDVAPGPPLLVAGYGFSGKTLSLQDLALSVATGTPVWGTFPVRTGKVLHVDYEQGAHLTRLRYQRLARARGIRPTDLEDRLNLAPLPDWYLDADAGDKLKRLCEGVDLLIVDSFRAACPRTEENSSDARIPLDRLTRISEETGATSIVIHHARKPSKDSQGGARMSIRGSGALYDACGSVLVFSAEKGEPITVEHDKARITGRTHESLRLWIEDVEVDGDPLAGLRVSTLSTPPPDQQTADQRLGELQGRVLAFVEAQGGTSGGCNVIHEHLGGRRQSLTAAIAELVRLGRLTRGGSTKEPTLSLAGTT